MFDDLNVESYARFAYSELSRRIAEQRQFQHYDMLLKQYLDLLAQAEKVLTLFQIDKENPNSTVSAAPMGGSIIGSISAYWKMNLIVSTGITRKTSILQMISSKIIILLFPKITMAALIVVIFSI